MTDVAEIARGRDRILGQSVGKRGNRTIRLPTNAAWGTYARQPERAARRQRSKGAGLDGSAASPATRRSVLVCCLAVRAHLKGEGQ